MKIYLAGERAATEAGTRIEQLSETAAGVWVKYIKRRLFSYYYHGYGATRIVYGTQGLSIDIERALELGMDTFCDSGAFTAFTKGTDIPLEQYAEYLKKTAHVWTTASSLDAIGSGEEAAAKSYANFIALRGMGAMVQPVFHVREPDHWLQRYIDEGWSYIFIGGMVPESTPWLLERLDALWDTILSTADGLAKVQTHGFGLTDQKLMFRYPWHSVDSTSWLMTGIFGACMFRLPTGRLTKVVFSEESPQARKFNGWHYSRLSGPEREVVDNWLAPYGVSAEQCGSHYSYRDVVNAAVFQNLEDMGATRFTRTQGGLF